MLIHWNQRVPSLLSISIEFILQNIKDFSNDDCDQLKYLPIRIKNILLKKLTTNSSHFANLSKLFRSFANSRLEVLDLTSVRTTDEILQTLEVCTGLRRVHLTIVKGYEFTTIGLINFLRNLSKLEILQMRNCDVVNNVVLECVSENCPKLNTLDVSGCKSITDNGLEKLENLSELTCLSLSHTQITNKGLTSFVHKNRNGKKLIELKIDNCKGINELGLMAVTEYCPNLKILTFNNCSSSDDNTRYLLLQENTMKNLRNLTFSVSW